MSRGSHDSRVLQLVTKATKALRASDWTLRQIDPDGLKYVATTYLRTRSWRDPKGDIVSSCTIITTAANDLLSPVHDRMPVILPRGLESFWLDHHIQDHVALSDVLAPYPSAAMEAFEVSSLVNSPSNNGPEVLVPVGRGT